MLPITNTASPPNTNGFLPSASAKGPTKSWPTANTTKKTLSVNASSRGSTPRSRAIGGKAGSMMLVASAPSAAKLASSTSRPALRRCAASDGLASGAGTETIADQRLASLAVRSGATRMPTLLHASSGISCACSAALWASKLAAFIPAMRQVRAIQC